VTPVNNDDYRSTVLQALRPVERAINPATRRAVQIRWDAMLRELAYLRERRDARVQFVSTKGWSVEKLAVLLWCNSFYQLVMGPLESSLRVSMLSLGIDVPISHGSEHFDSRRAAGTKQAVTAFAEVIGRLGFQKRWLCKNTTGDVLFFLDRHERDNEGLFEDLDAD
jgi:hypothetical protein